MRHFGIQEMITYGAWLTRLRSPWELIIMNNIFTTIETNHTIQVFSRKGYQTIDDIVISDNVIDGVQNGDSKHVTKH